MKELNQHAVEKISGGWSWHTPFTSAYAWLPRLALYSPSLGNGTLNQNYQPNYNLTNPNIYNNVTSVSNVTSYIR